MEAYIPYNVYTNIVKMFGYRNIQLRGEPLAEDQIVQKLNHYEFVTIIGSRGNDPRGAADCYVILIAPGSKYSNKSQDFKKLLRGIPDKNEGLEVMFVSEEKFTVHIEKQVAQFKATKPKVYVENYDYEMFIIEKPRHESTPPHSIATEAEVDEICQRHYTTKDKFPKIPVTDTQAVWIGAKLGMVVKVIRVSETAGTAIAYRYVTR
jgi:DNA-directed RNA polymerase subunit H